MSLILNIDTALSTGSISLCNNGIVLSYRVNENDRDHATWLHPAIKEIFKEINVDLKSLKAVAVSHGPGSYTGLRIGLSTAKGLCYALNIPLITISTLDIMASAGVEIIPQYEIKNMDLLCPMIDARRMEVYFAVYDLDINRIIEPSSAIVTENFLDTLLLEKRIIFFGSGSEKLKILKQHPHVFYSKFDFYGAIEMNKKSLLNYDNAVFNDLALSEPLYIKEFYDVTAK